MLSGIGARRSIMERDSAPMERTGAAVGIDELLGTPSPVVRASIKRSPQDFQVREIGADGVVVAFSDQKDRVPTQAERQAVLQKLLDARTASAAAKPERLTFAEPADGWRKALEALVGVDGAAQMEKVARRGVSEHRVSAPENFRDRVYLQECIQSSFAGLDCKLEKAMSGSVATVCVTMDPVYRKLLDGGMSTGNCDKVLRFLRAGGSDPAAVRGLELDHGDSKDERTAAHRLLSKHTSCFKTATETRGGMQRVVVYFSPKSGTKRKRSQPEALLRFVLRKTNLEHFSCMEMLSRLLRCPQSALAVAGTKDKAAVTYQHATVRGVTPDRLLALNRAGPSGEASSASAVPPSFEVGDLAYVSSPMALGDAHGNRFSIVLRDLAVTDAAELEPTLASNIRHVQRRGFINYFGFQRVGCPSSAVRPPHIGAKLVAGDWRAALRLMLAVDEREPAETQLAKRAFLDRGDVDGALKRLPMGLRLERTLLQGLKRHGVAAFEQAIAGVPHSRRLLLLHAYQSELFNRAASVRVRLDGRRAIEGDLVAADGHGDASARAVTREEAARMNETLENPLASVLLPLPGTNVLLPANAVGDAIRQMAAQDGTEDALLRSGPLRGTYRRLVALPTGVEWAMHEGAKDATVAFSLPAGSFATMCLREVLKSDL